MNDAIDRYLDRLGASTRYRVNSQRARDDAEEHLRDAQAELVARGLDAHAAAELAVERFGTTRLISRELARCGGSLPLQIVRAAAPLMAVGLVAVGLAGLAAMVIATVAHDDAGTAATLGQIAAGFVGVSLLEARRRNSATGATFTTPGLPPRLLPVVAMAMFALSAASMTAVAVTLMTTRGYDHSAGAMTTAVALLASTAWSATRLRTAGRSSDGGAGTGAEAMPRIS